MATNVGFKPPSKGTCMGTWGGILGPDRGTINDGTRMAVKARVVGVTCTL